MNALSNNTAIHYGSGIKIACKKLSYGPAGQHVVDSTMDRENVTCLRCLAKMAKPEAKPVVTRPLSKRLQTLLDSMTEPVSLAGCSFSLYSDMQELKRRGLIAIDVIVDSNNAIVDTIARRV